MRRTATLLSFALPLLLCAQNFQPSPVFGNNGAVHVDVAPGADMAHAHTLLPDGKLLVVGGGYYVNLNSFHVSLARFDTVCGSLDASFGNGGFVERTFEQRTQCVNMTVQPNGCIVGCGMIAPDNSGSLQWPGVFRFLPDGSVDNTFNGTGYNRMLFNGGTGHFTGCFVNADNTITCTAAGSGIGAVRFTPTGTPDPTFGTGGTAALAGPFGPLSSKGTGLMRPDSSVVSIVIASNGMGNVLALAQFDHAGAPDISFGTGGLAVSPVVVSSSTIDGGVGASLLPDGRILVSCMATDPLGGFLMARFLANGIVDSTYATNGVSAVIRASTSAGQDHELLADGSTLQFGSFGTVGSVLKRDVNGQVVTTFGTDGFVDANTGFGNEQFVGGFTLPSGRIIGYGAYLEQFLVSRLTTDPVADALPSITLDGADLTTTGSGSFEWFLDGLLINGTIGNTITPTQNGVYTVTMTLSSDCVFTSDPFNMLSVGMDESNANGSIHVYPVPASDRLSISGLVATEGMSTTAIDASGRCINLAWSDPSTLNIASLAMGTYTLELFDHERILRLRFIKH